jgi:flagellar hook-basal body complex protein FliE
MSDISALNSISSEYIKNAALHSATLDTEDKSFGTFLQSAVDMVNQTNQLQLDYKKEELNVALGYSDNTHDLSIAQSKAATALQYTVAVRDRFLEAYKEIMNIQI